MVVIVWEDVGFVIEDASVNTAHHELQVAAVLVPGVRNWD